MGLLHLLAKLVEFSLLFFLLLLLLVQLFLHIVSLMAEHLHLIIQINQLSMRNSIPKETASVRTQLPGQSVLRFLLCCLECLIILLQVLDSSLVCVTLFVKISQVLPVLDLIILLLEARHLLLGILQLLLSVLDLIQLVGYLLLLLLLL